VVWRVGGWVYLLLFRFFLFGRNFLEASFLVLRRRERMLSRSGAVPCQIGLIRFLAITVFMLRRSAFVKSVRATPFRPILAVRPVRWVYASRPSGKS